MTSRAARAIVLLIVTAASGAERLEEIEQRLQATDAEARALDEQARGVLGEIERTDREIEALQGQVSRLDAEVRAGRAREERARERVATLDARLETLRHDLEARAAALYRLSRRGLGPVLFRRLGELGETRRRQRWLTAVLEHDRELVRETRATRAAAEAAQRDAEAATRALLARRREREKELGRLAAARAGKEEQLASLRREGETRERLRAELGAAAARLEKMLASPTAPRATEPARSGSWVPPLDDLGGGAIGARHGVEIPASVGAAIRAIGAGQVVFADWFPGYGKMVIIDHGHGIHSIYGYAETLLVAAGDRVSAGQSIARAGRTGLAADARLYFEVRRDGRPEPPARYVPALSARAARPATPRNPERIDAVGGLR